MGEFEYEVYVIVWTWVLVLSGVSDLGIPTAMLRRLPEFLSVASTASCVRRPRRLGPSLEALVRDAEDLCSARRWHH
jgi:hypothetical protein